MDYNFKLWLEKEGQLVLGDGLHCLLTMVEQQGSIKKAAEALHMSYRQAWGNIKKAEERLGMKLLIKKVGGESGGGAKLTPEGHEFLVRYSDFRREVDGLIKSSFERYFG